MGHWLSLSRPGSLSFLIWGKCYLCQGGSIFLKCVGPQVPPSSSGVPGAASIHQGRPGPHPAARGSLAPTRRWPAAWPRPALALEKVSKRRCSALIGRGGCGPVVRQPMSGAGRELKGGGGGPRSDPCRPRPPQLLPPPPVLVRRARVSAALQPPPGVGAAQGPPPPRANSSAPAGRSQRSRDPRPSLYRDPACASLPGHRVSAGPGRWARKSRFSGASLPNFVPSYFCFSRPALRPCQLSLARCLPLLP